MRYAALILIVTATPAAARYEIQIALALAEARQASDAAEVLHNKELPAKAEPSKRARQAAPLAKSTLIVYGTETCRGCRMFALDAAGGGELGSYLKDRFTTVHRRPPPGMRSIPQFQVRGGAGYIGYPGQARLLTWLKSQHARVNK